MVFRLCSLWLQSLEKDKLVNDAVASMVPTIESRKFLPLMYQLAARLSFNATEHPEFQVVLKRLIVRMATDHPHHTLYQIFALKNPEIEPAK